MLWSSLSGTLRTTDSGVVILMKGTGPLFPSSLDLVTLGQIYVKQDSWTVIKLNSITITKSLFMLLDFDRYCSQSSLYDKTLSLLVFNLLFNFLFWFVIQVISINEDTFNCVDQEFYIEC